MEYRENLVSLAQWSFDFEIPDVVGFADYISSANQIAGSLSKQSAQHCAGDLLIFPYPNTLSKLRLIAVAPPDALLQLRVAAGRIAHQTESLLSPRVFSHRVVFKPHSWSFHDRKRSYRDFVETALDELSRSTAMCRTDVERYYPSIRSDILEKWLSTLGCDSSALLMFSCIIRLWQCTSGLVGLPIGPEACTVVGNGFLAAVDRAIEAAKAMHLRWGDDTLIFGAQTKSCEAVLSIVDEKLSALGLNRSLSKTTIFDDPEKAAESLRDGWLASLGYLLKHDQPLGLKAVRSAFDAQIRGRNDIQGSRFRFVIRTLQNRRDSYACLPLAIAPGSMNIDPRQSADYLSECGIQQPPVIEALMHKVSQRSEERFDALDLHLFRAMSRSRRLGEAEGREFHRVARDSSRRWPIRAWAWQAYARSAARTDRELMESAREEKDTSIRRAIVVTLKGSHDGRHRRNFLRHVMENFPESRHAARWIEAG